MALSLELRRIILEKLKKGINKADIARAFNVSLRTVYSINKQGAETIPSVKRLKKSKQSKQVIKRAMRALTKKNVRVSCNEIAKKVSSTLSKSTIRRNLISLGYKYIPTKSAIILSKPQKEERVKIVRTYITQRIDFHKVVFTDESRFSLDGNDNYHRWSKNSRLVLNRRPYKGGSIMIWGAITYTGQLILRKVEGTLNSEKYCDLLIDDIFPILRSSIDSFIFQQDNAPCHKSRYTMSAIEDEDVSTLKWPAHSPDLSPIEKVWSILKGRVYMNGQFNNKECLWTKIKSEGDKLANEETNLFQRLYDRFYENMCDILCSNGELIV